MNVWTDLWAFTGPTPAHGYVGFVNVSAQHGRVRVTVRTDGSENGMQAEFVLTAEQAAQLVDKLDEYLKVA